MLRALIEALAPAPRAAATLPTHTARLVVAVAVVVFVVALPPLPLLGDGMEYAATMMALLNHATPDIRAGDLTFVPSLFEPYGYSGLNPLAVVTASDGRTYGMHFWLYSLVCAPAALLLRTVGLSPLLAFAATNTALFVAAAATALWSRRLTPRDRTLVALTVISPVLRYLQLAHPEAFTCACVLASLIAFNHARYGIAALCAAGGALQNPPVGALVLYCLFIAVHERRWRAALAAASAVPLLLLPPLHFVLAIGEINPIATRGVLQLNWGVVERAWGLLTDLDQGLIVHVPGLVMLAALNLRGANNVRHLGMVVVFCAFLFGAATSVGANTPFSGMMRYAIWMLPVLAWLATEALHLRRYASAMLAAVLIAHGALVMQTPIKVLDNGRLSTYALTNWPAWYHPAPGTFADRLLNRDLSLFEQPLPIGFMRTDGVITKLLVDPQSIAQLEARFIIDPGYLQEVTAASATRTRLYYLNPPDGAVRSQCPTSLGKRSFRDAVDVQVVDVPPSHPTRRLPITIDVRNQSERAICNLGSGGRQALNILTMVRQGRQELSAAVLIRAPPVLRPGVTVRQRGIVGLPARSGRYEIDILPSLEEVAHGRRRATLIVDVVDEPSYHATITVAGAGAP